MKVDGVLRTGRNIGRNFLHRILHRECKFNGKTCWITENLSHFQMLSELVFQEAMAYHLFSVSQKA